MSETAPRDEYSRTSAILGMEFDACSSAAREANEEATQLLAGRKHTETLHLIQDPEAGSAVENTFDVVDLHSVVSAHLTGYTVQLKLIQPRNAKHTTANIGSHARLVAVLHDDLAVPLAGFARRKTESGCDHVQLEGEQHDENYVILPRDSRSRSVRAITGWVKGAPTPEHIELIHEITHRSLTYHTEKIEEELGPVLARHVFRRMQTPRFKIYDKVYVPTEVDTAKTEMWDDPVPAFHRPVKLPEYIGSYSVEKPLSIFKDGTVAEGNALVNYVQNGYVQLEDGRPVRLAFVAEKYGIRYIPYKKYEAQDDIWLTAITRESVAVPIVRLTTDGKTQRMAKDGSFDDLSLQDILLLFKTTDLSHENDGGINILREIQKIVAKFGPERPRRLGRAMTSLYFHSRPGENICVRRPLPGLKRAVSTPVNPLHKALEKLKTQEANGWYRTNTLAVVRLFDVQSQFTEMLGEYNPVEEAVFQTIGKLAEKGTKFTGRLEKFPINGEETDVDVFTEITEEKGGHRVVVRGRPAIYRERHPSLLYDTVVHRAQELRLEPDEITDMQRLLGSLSMKISRFDGGRMLSTGASSVNALWE